MADPSAEALETLRQLTLQVMLISAGVFGIVGGFVSSTEKKFVRPRWLAVALVMFSLSSLAGYILHGILISLIHANAFDPFAGKLVFFGVVQIGTFFVGGICFTVFVICNVNK